MVDKFFLKKPYSQILFHTTKLIRDFRCISYYKSPTTTTMTSYAPSYELKAEQKIWFSNLIAEKKGSHLKTKKCEVCGDEMIDHDEALCSVCDVKKEERRRMKEMEQYDRYILWTKKNIDKAGFVPHEDITTFHQVNYYCDDMLEDMNDLIMKGGIDAVGISSMEGGDDEKMCLELITMERCDHLIYGWTAKKGANTHFKKIHGGSDLPANMVEDLRKAGKW